MKAAEKCPNISHQPIRGEAALPSGYWPKCGNLGSFPLKRCIYVYNNKESKTLRKISKTSSGSYPNYFRSHHATLAKLKLVRQSL
jgi:hypothetical protein